MIQYQQSSGNVVADKRAHYARQCADSKDYDVAIDVMTQALELAPHWASGWYSLGEYLEKTNNVVGAHSAYGQALYFSNTDYLGAGLKIAHLAQVTLDTVPLAYTDALFDGYADRFDIALVKTLNYVAPMRLAAMLQEKTTFQKFAKAIDLGCGTGLMAAQVRHQIGQLTGVDLSASMLAKAMAKGLYDRLIKADMTDALLQHTGMSLVMAADVFIYSANLEQVFSLVSASLQTQGLFLFCVEKHDGFEPWKLRESMRHAHSEHYVDTILFQNGFVVLAQETGPIRSDCARPVVGLYYLAQKQTAAQTHAA
jgi:predicted TPR repeat methyltransferase